MVHDGPENDVPHTTTGSQFDPTTTEGPVDVKNALNRLVNAVEYSVTSFKPQDRAQMFGEQFACFLRGLDDLEFYDAIIYATTYMKNMTEKKIAEKSTNS